MSTKKGIRAQEVRNRKERLLVNQRFSERVDELTTQWEDKEDELDEFNNMIPHTNNAILLAVIESSREEVEESASQAHQELLELLDDEVSVAHSFRAKYDNLMEALQDDKEYFNYIVDTANNTLIVLIKTEFPTRGAYDVICELHITDQQRIATYNNRSVALNDIQAINAVAEEITTDRINQLLNL